ncbi:hypothetical protein [Effusibacillus consociatus]|uniref:Uncharacterized protein n=1 Tax=Effusibacillus consociatus TaxID=1117041 RepID=A0ABV9Q6W2_9BACL
MDELNLTAGRLTGRAKALQELLKKMELRLRIEKTAITRFHEKSPHG